MKEFMHTFVIGLLLLVSFPSLASALPVKCSGGEYKYYNGIGEVCNKVPPGNYAAAQSISIGSPNVSSSTELWVLGMAANPDFTSLLMAVNGGQIWKTIDSGRKWFVIEFSA